MWGGSGDGGSGRRVAAPRQLSASTCMPAAPAGSGLLLGGISSFAFQGTNAHAILGKQLDRGSGGGPFAMPGPSAAFLAAAGLQSMRYWVLPEAHPLVSWGSASGRVAIFECLLAAPRLALYSDHTVFGRVLFPGAGMLEAALAAGATALGAGTGATPAGQLAVRGMAITSPLVIPPPAAQKVPIVLRCRLDSATGELGLSHGTRPAAASVQNATCTLALATATAASVAVLAAAAVAASALAVKRVLLVKSLAALAASAPGHATGTIAAGGKPGCNDGYLVPPPCIDACLHLGVAVPGCGAKVPVAVGSFAPAARHATGPGVGAAGAELAGSTSAAYSIPMGSVDTASFALHTAAGCSFAGLADLQTKVTKPKAAGQSAAAAASVKPSDFLYEVDWEAASHPAPPNGTGGQHMRGAAFLAFGNVRAEVQLTTAPLAATVAALSLVQHAQATQASSLTAALPEVLPGGETAASGAGSLLAAGALEGLLRVAATEHAAAGYSLAASEARSSGTGPHTVPGSQHPQKLGILSTERLHAGVATAPRLLPRYVGAAANAADACTRLSPSVASLSAAALWPGRLTCSRFAPSREAP